MTTRERILHYIRDYIEREQWAPTISEITAAVGLASRSTTHTHLLNLERAGLIELGHAANHQAGARMIRLPRKETTQ